MHIYIYHEEQVPGIIHDVHDFTFRRRSKYQVDCFALCTHYMCIFPSPMTKRFQAYIYAYIALDRLGVCK